MITRRKPPETRAATGLTLAAAGLGASTVARGVRFRLGHVSAQSGPSAGLAAADRFVIDGFDAVAGNDFEAIVMDSQSNPNRAAQVAGERIIDDGIDLMPVASSPETTTPVATTCALEEGPVISAVAPRQSWFIGQQRNPGDPGRWQPLDCAFLFFSGVMSPRCPRPSGRAWGWDGPVGSPSPSGR